MKQYINTKCGNIFLCEFNNRNIASSYLDVYFSGVVYLPRDSNLKIILENFEIVDGSHSFAKAIRLLPYDMFMHFIDKRIVQISLLNLYPELIKGYYEVEDIIL